MPFHLLLQSSVALFAILSGAVRLAELRPPSAGAHNRWTRIRALAVLLGGGFLIVALWVPVMMIPAIFVILATLTIALIGNLRARRPGSAVAVMAMAGVVCWLAIDRGPWALDYFTRFAPKPAGIYAPLPARTIARFPQDAPILLESIVPLADGAFYVSAGSKGQIWHIARDGRKTLLVQLPHGGFGLKRFQGVVGGITLGPDGLLYASLVALDPRQRGVWVIDPRTRTSRILSRLPETAQPNGITFGPDGNIYVADSELATIWRVSPGSGTALPWLKAPELGRAISWLVPGANGIKVFDRTVYVSNSFTGKIYKIALAADGRAGPLIEIASDLSGDDFSLDVRGNIYVTTHPFNSVIRVAPNGQRTIIADERQGVVGPTDAKFGVGYTDRGILYVVNDGGFVVSHPDGVPSITAINVGVPGYAIP